MADDDDENECLLTTEENRSGRRRKGNRYREITGAVSVDDRDGWYDSNSDDVGKNSLQTLSENDFIIAVFVVAFDTKTGKQNSLLYIFHVCL